MSSARNRLYDKGTTWAESTTAPRSEMAPRRSTSVEPCNRAPRRSARDRSAPVRSQPVSVGAGQRRFVEVRAAQVALVEHHPLAVRHAEAGLVEPTPDEPDVAQLRPARDEPGHATIAQLDAGQRRLVERGTGELAVLDHACRSVADDRRSTR